jgi:predicted SAM-dependent methyltransferase
MVKKLRLDLGCGLEPLKGFVGVDMYTGPEHIDLTVFPWPWADGSVDEVHCAHFIEHLPRGVFVPFVDELHRILKPGAKATIVHPNLKSARAFQDPTHQDFIPAERWMYVQQGWRAANGLDRPPYPTCDFDVEIGAAFAPEFAARSDEATMQAAVYQWDVALDLQVILTKRG